MGARESSSFISVCFCNKFHTCWFCLQPFFHVRPLKEEEGKTCKPTKNQFPNSSWNLGRHLGPALLIAAAAVGPLLP